MAATNEQADVLILGAGPAGLAIDDCLNRSGRGPLILETPKKSTPPGKGTASDFSSTPPQRYSALPFPSHVGRCPPREGMNRYLENTMDGALERRADIWVDTSWAIETSSWGNPRTSALAHARLPSPSEGDDERSAAVASRGAGPSLSESLFSV